MTQFDAGSAHTVTSTEGLLIDFNSERRFLSVAAPDANLGPVWLRMSAVGTAVVGAGVMLRPGDVYLFENNNRYTGGIRAVAEEVCTVAVAEF